MGADPPATARPPVGPRPPCSSPARSSASRTSGSATGPAGYDCSGRTGAARRAADVELPRVSQDRWKAGRRIARGDLQPGDLVFFHPDIHHVGPHIGGGTMIHAPRTGTNVEVPAIDAVPYVGAVRPQAAAGPPDPLCRTPPVPAGGVRHGGGWC
ncbi:C40 family peptidase [Kitasatospora sp. NPDC003701]